MVTLTISNIEAEVFSRILQDCSETFGRRGCNDFKCESLEESRALQEAFVEVGLQGIEDANPDSLYLFDFMVVNLFMERLNRVIKPSG